MNYAGKGAQIPESSIGKNDDNVARFRNKCLSVMSAAPPKNSPSREEADLYAARLRASARAALALQAGLGLILVGTGILLVRSVMGEYPVAPSTLNICTIGGLVVVSALLLWEGLSPQPVYRRHARLRGTKPSRDAVSNAGRSETPEEGADR